MPDNGKKILLADDDALIAGLHMEALKAAGFSVELAFDGEQAIEKLEKMREEGVMPAAVLLDIMMPKKNGLDVLRFMKGHEAFKRTPIIMLTNLADTEDVEKALEEGAVLYMVKVQYTPREVAAKVCEVVASYAGDKPITLTPSAGTSGR